MSGGGIPTALLGQSADTVFAAFGGGDAGDLVDVEGSFDVLEDEVVQ